MLALSAGHKVVACLHHDLQQSKNVQEFVDRGGILGSWSFGRVARFEKWRQRVRPNFTDENLGKPDVVVVSLGSLLALTYVPGLVDYLLGCQLPVVVICQFNSDCVGISPAQRDVIQQILKKSSKQVFVSRHNLELARRQYVTALPEAEVIYNPIRSTLPSPLPPPDETGVVVFGCVARFETLWKGQDLLVEILSSSPWRERKWKLRFFGDGPDLEHVRSYCSFVGLQEKIIFEGYRRDLSEIWSGCHAMLLPSRGEGTPLAVLEAMMCGRPVVITDVGGNAEILEDGVTGWIAEAATVRSFGKALERAWEDRDRWEEMGKAAHAKAVELANDQPAEKLLEITQEALNIKK